MVPSVQARTPWGRRHSRRAVSYVPRGAMGCQWPPCPGARQRGDLRGGRTANHRRPQCRDRPPAQPNGGPLNYAALKRVTEREVKVPSAFWGIPDGLATLRRACPRASLTRAQRRAAAERLQRARRVRVGLVRGRAAPRWAAGTDCAPVLRRGACCRNSKAWRCLRGCQPGKVGRRPPGVGAGKRSSSRMPLRSGWSCCGRGSFDSPRRDVPESKGYALPVPRWAQVFQPGQWCLAVARPPLNGPPDAPYFYEGIRAGARSREASWLLKGTPVRRPSGG